MFAVKTLAYEFLFSFRIRDDTAPDPLPLAPFLPRRWKPQKLLRGRKERGGGTSDERRREKERIKKKIVGFVAGLGDVPPKIVRPNHRQRHRPRESLPLRWLLFLHGPVPRFFRVSFFAVPPSEIALIVCDDRATRCPGRTVAPRRATVILERSSMLVASTRLKIFWVSVG